MPIRGDAARAAESALRFRSARGAVLAANVANADTPGYRRADVRFENALSQATLRLAATHPGHRSEPSLHDPASWRLERGPRGERPDGNGVSIDEEVLEVSRNASAFQQQATMLSRLAGLTRLAIRGDR